MSGTLPDLPAFLLARADEAQEWHKVYRHHNGNGWERRCPRCGSGWADDPDWRCSSWLHGETLRKLVRAYEVAFERLDLPTDPRFENLRACRLGICATHADALRIVAQQYRWHPQFDTSWSL